MKKRKFLASAFIVIALILGALFYSEIVFPENLGGYFKSEYFNQFGPLAISIELLIAGIYLFIGHPKTNFTMALFAFTTLLDPLFKLIGLITSIVPIYAMVILFCCALIAIWLAFTNAFNLGRISFIGALGSFILGSIVELFFNYF